MVQWTGACSAVALAVITLGGCSESPSQRWTGKDAAVDRYVFQFPEAGDGWSVDGPPPLSDRCLGATALVLAGGKATVTGDTATATNEFGAAVRCGEAQGFAGPQRYHRLTLQQGRLYRVQLTADFEAVLYLFNQCSATLINVDCASAGATGDLLGPLAPGVPGELTFLAPASGDVVLAVDSPRAEAAGSYTLEVEELQVPAHGSCAAPEPLSLGPGDAVTVQGSTLGAVDEQGGQLSCGLSATLDGPQLYYSVPLTAGNWYRFTLAPQFGATLYVVPVAAGCVASNMDADCSGITGTVMPQVPQGGQRSTAFRPLADGDYLVVVDSVDPIESGGFSLTVERFSPPENMVCSQARALGAVAAAQTVMGSTAGLDNDLGALMRCGASAPLTGPQAYYTVQLQAQQPYLLQLQPEFNARLAVGRSCLSLPADCATAGLSGGSVAVPAGALGQLEFTPATVGEHVVLVEGAEPAAAGLFTLQLAPKSSTSIGSCQQPAELTLGQSPLELLGDTGPLKNDLVGISCGLAQGPWIGPQAYYRVELRGGTSYTVTLLPEPTFDPALYAFAASAGCAPGAVEQACQGQAADSVGAGIAESLVLSPAQDTEMLLVVDSWSASAVGRYTLRISWP